MMFASTEKRKRSNARSQAKQCHQSTEAAGGKQSKFSGDVISIALAIC